MANNDLLDSDGNEKTSKKSNSDAANSGRRASTATDGKIKSNKSKEAKKPATPTKVCDETWICSRCTKAFSDPRDMILECELCASHACHKCLDLTKDKYCAMSRDDVVWLCGRKCQQEINDLISLKKSLGSPTSILERMNSMDKKLDKLQRMEESFSKLDKLDKLLDVVDNMKALGERMTLIENDLASIHQQKAGRETGIRSSNKCEQESR